jgi:proline iminopeptidase
MTAPVLVLQGQCDFLAYGDVYEYAAAFPNARYRYVPRAGHIIWWDQPTVYQAAIRDFLNGVETAP